MMVHDRNWRPVLLLFTFATFISSCPMIPHVDFMDIPLHDHFSSWISPGLFLFPLQTCCTVSFEAWGSRLKTLSLSLSLSLDRSAFSMHLSLRKIPTIDYGFVRCMGGVGVCRPRMASFIFVIILLFLL